MARKHVDLKAAKAAKQKKIAIGAGLLFVALLIVSVPRTMKLMHPHHGVATSTHAPTTSTTSTTPAATTAATPSTPATPAGVPVSDPTTAPVLTARLAPPAREGQLAALSASFKAKDPFKQLIDPNAVPPAPATTTAESAGSAQPAGPKAPATELKVVPAAKPAAAPAQAPAPKPVMPRVVVPLLSAVISVNGAPEGVNLRLNFPSGAPLFHLISLTKKTAKVSVVGGSLVGAPTLTLRRGKPVTLVNTADGTRYELELVSTSAKAIAAKTSAQPAQTKTQPASTTPTATTPTTTTATDTIAVPALGG